MKKPGGGAEVPAPSGTVTFLFSDIEGSTQRWDRDRGAMQEAVRMHDRLLHQALAANGGYVFKTIGERKALRGLRDAGISNGRRASMRSARSVQRTSRRSTACAFGWRSIREPPTNATVTTLGRPLTASRGSCRSAMVAKYCCRASLPIWYARDPPPAHPRLKELGAHVL